MNAAPPPGATLVDARGMHCPWPALRLARAVRAGAAHVVLLADDPKAEVEVAALAAAHGWTLFAADGRFDIRIDAAATSSLPDRR